MKIPVCCGATLAMACFCTLPLWAQPRAPEQARGDVSFEPQKIPEAHVRYRASAMRNSYSRFSSLVRTDFEKANPKFAAPDLVQRIKKYRAHVKPGPDLWVFTPRHLIETSPKTFNEAKVQLAELQAEHGRLVDAIDERLATMIEIRVANALAPRELMLANCYARLGRDEKALQALARYTEDLIECRWNATGYADVEAETMGLLQGRLNNVDSKSETVRRIVDRLLALAPPVRLTGKAERDAKILQYHQAIVHFAVKHGEPQLAKLATAQADEELKQRLTDSKDDPALHAKYERVRDQLRINPGARPDAEGEKPHPFPALGTLDGIPDSVDIRLISILGVDDPKEKRIRDWLRKNPADLSNRKEIEQLLDEMTERRPQLRTAAAQAAELDFRCAQLIYAAQLPAKHKQAVVWLERVHKLMPHAEGFTRGVGDIVKFFSHRPLRLPDEPPGEMPRITELMLALGPYALDWDKIRGELARNSGEFSLGSELSFRARDYMRAMVWNLTRDGEYRHAAELCQTYADMLQVNAPFVQKVSTFPNGDSLTRLYMGQSQQFCLLRAHCYLAAGEAELAGEAFGDYMKNVNSLPRKQQALRQGFPASLHMWEKLAILGLGPDASVLFYTFHGLPKFTFKFHDFKYPPDVAQVPDYLLPEAGLRLRRKMKEHNRLRAWR